MLRTAGVAFFGALLMVAIEIPSLARSVDAAYHTPPCGVSLQTTIGFVKEPGTPSAPRSLQAAARIVDARDMTKGFGLYAIDEQAHAWVLIQRGVTRRDALGLLAGHTLPLGSFQPISNVSFPPTLRLDACVPRGQ
jgi:hypothetical protein